MAGRFSTYSAGLVLNKLLRSVDWTPSTSYWVALFRAANDADLRANSPSAASEVTAGGAYGRIEVRGATGKLFGVPVAGVSTLDSIVEWQEATASWGVITYSALMDSATLNAGNVILYGPLSIPTAMDIGDKMTVPIGMFAIGL